MEAAQTGPAQPGQARQERILQATVDLLAGHGISGVSIRAVAREAGVALGLVGYHFQDKVGLVRAALVRIGEQDLALLDGDPALPAAERVRAALRRVADPELLTTGYLSRRLQLWSLAQAHPEYERVNTDAQRAYRDRLAALILAARPELGQVEADRRAADIDVLQNGLWLTVLLGLDAESVARCVDRCERIALDPRPVTASGS